MEPADTASASQGGDHAATARRSRLRIGDVVRAGAAVARHPSLWPVAVRQGCRLRAPGRLTPAPDYVAFRLVTQYGGDGTRPEPGDVVSYLRWCRQWEVLTR